MIGLNESSGGGPEPLKSTPAYQEILKNFDADIDKMLLALTEEKSKEGAIETFKLLLRFFDKKANFCHKMNYQHEADEALEKTKKLEDLFEELFGSEEIVLPDFVAKVKKVIKGS